MDQLMLMMSNAKINSENNLFFTMFFISILFTGEFQEKVRQALVDFMKMELYRDSTLRSKHAVDEENDFCNYYSNFSNVEAAIRFHIKPLEEACTMIQQAKMAKKERNEKSVSGRNEEKHITRSARLMVTFRINVLLSNRKSTLVNF
jgi:hypothetical protein